MLVTRTLDIRAILEEGNQPVHEALTSIRALKDNEILKIIAPFLPAPLIDKAPGLGYSHWVNQWSAEEYHIYFRKTRP